MVTYSTKGTCSKQIIFELDEENRVHNVKLIGGCSGNLQGISRLVEGKKRQTRSSHFSRASAANRTPPVPTSSRRL